MATKVGQDQSKLGFVDGDSEVVIYDFIFLRGLT